MIDIHCHLLPGVDDGCRNFDETVECITMLKSTGFVGSICTPHVGVARYDNTPDTIAAAFTQLQTDLDANGIDYQLWWGGEIRLPRHKRDLLLPVNDQTTPRLADGNCVLFDWWGKNWAEYLDDYFQQLLDQGLQPILAHPERLPMNDKTFRATIKHLVDDGIWLQGNLKSFTQQEQPRIHERAMRLLRNDRYRIIATDGHDPQSIPSRIEGLTILREIIGQPRLTELMVENPAALLK